MKNLPFIILFILYSVADVLGQPLTKGYAVTDISDLVLIYQGGTHRLDWNKEQFTPYVVHKDQAGNKNWLFDGFLFLEFKDGKGYSYAMGYEKKNARKKEWQWLIDRMFEEEKALKALNECIQDQIVQLGNPNFKHKVVIGIPEPSPGQKDWGKLNNRELDFDKQADKIAAVKWYIDQVEEKFTKSQLNNLELSGYYWVSEDMVYSRPITKEIGDYIRSKKELFYWIPYWNAMGYSEWHNLGFDVAYAQPNHFFDDFKTDERISKTCKLAHTYGLGLELEFDSRALNNSTDSKRKRLETYLDGFEQEVVFNKSAIAYYEGGGAILDFDKSKDIKDQEIMDRIAHYIWNRNAYKEKHNDEIITGKATTSKDVFFIDDNRIAFKKETGWQYGRIDINAKIESPNTDICIRLLPVDERFGKWPNSGEITIMHHNNNEPNKIRGGIYTQKLNLGTGNKKETLLPIHSLYNADHTYSCVWTSNDIQLYVDDVLFFAMDDDFAKDTGYWPFNQPFYLEISANNSYNKALIKINDISLSQGNVLR